MYPLVRLLSFIVRAAICYLTVETTPIFANSLVAWSIDQIVSIYSILWFISYVIVSRVFGYRRGSDPIIGVMYYAIVYIPLSLVLWAVLAFLTAIGVLPL